MRVDDNSPAPQRITTAQIKPDQKGRADIPIYYGYYRPTKINAIYTEIVLAVCGIYRYILSMEREIANHQPNETTKNSKKETTMRDPPDIYGINDTERIERGDIFAP